MNTIDALGDAYGESGSDFGNSRSLPQVKLDQNDVGTFLYPPSSYSDLTSYVNFWATVEISDGILGNLTAAYADLIRKQNVAAAADFIAKYDRNHPEIRSANEKKREIAIDERGTAYARHTNDFEDSQPQVINPTVARSIARAGQMYYYSSILTEEEDRQLRKATMRIGSSDRTVEEICIRYHLKDLRAYFQEPSVTASERLEDIRTELRRIQNMA